MSKINIFKRFFIIFYFFIYISNDLVPQPRGWRTIPRKERRRKDKGEELRNGKGPKVNQPTQSQAIDAFIGDEKQNRKQKRTKRKK